MLLFQPILASCDVSVMGECATVPFHFVKPGVPLLMVPVMVNGRGPFDFIVDTGNAAKPILLSKALAAKLDIRSKGASKRKGFAVGVDTSMGHATVDRFGFGNLTFKRLNAGISPALDQLAERLDARIEGNIGYGFFKDYCVTVDYKASCLALSKETPSGAFVPFEIHAGKPLIIVDVEANGQPMKFALDTGASATCISLGAASKLGLAKGSETNLNKSEKGAGYLTTLETLRVGDHEQKEIAAAAAAFLSEMSKAMKIEVDGVIGYNFLSKYRVTIDYPLRRLVLQGY